MAELGLCCCTRAFSSCGERGLLFVVVRGLLIAVPSLVERGLQVCSLQQLWYADSVAVACGLQSAGSVVVVHRLSCSVACGIFPDQGLNPCPLHWQEDSKPLHHQERPQGIIFESVVLTSTCELMCAMGNTKIGVKLVFLRVVIYYIYYTSHLFILFYFYFFN